MSFLHIDSIFSPRQCAMCGRALLLDEQEFCNRCVTVLPRTEEAVRRGNHLELRFSDCKKFVRGGAFCHYPESHPFRHAIHLFKFNGYHTIGSWLAARAATEWADSDFFEGIDYIIPIPLHPLRYKERGYNQAEWIARGLSEVTAIPVDTRHLIRSVNNSHQSQKSLEERRSMEQVFDVMYPDELRGKHVLLVDDVVTTGTTMRQAMAALQPIRGCRYSVFSLAIAQGS